VEKIHDLNRKDHEAGTEQVKEKEATKIEWNLVSWKVGERMELAK